MKFDLQSGHSVNLADVETIPIRCPAGHEFQALADTHRKDLFNHIKSYYSNGHEVINRIRTWKTLPGSQGAREHEDSFNRALGISRRVLKGPLSTGVPSDHVDAAEELHELTKQMVEEYHGSEFVLYRGANYEAPFLVAELLDNPQQTYDDPDKISVLSNYTRSKSRSISEYSSLIITKRNVVPSDVALASDALFGVEDKSGRLITPESELQVRNDRLTPISPGEVTVVISDPDRNCAIRELRVDDIISKLGQPGRLESHEHAGMKQLVSIMGQRSGVYPSNSSTQTDLKSWARYYDSNEGSGAYGLIQRVLP